jgi:uncharacterized membrane protein YdjX (TVP38/TMEM64 family)
MGSMTASPDQDEPMLDEPTITPARRWSRWWPIAVLIVGVGAFFGSGADSYLMLQTLHDNRMALVAFVHDYGALAVIVFLAVYIAATALAVPGALILTIAGGFLFGTWWGTVWVVIGATAGATLLFLAARTTLGDALRARAGPLLKKIEAGFGANAFSYLLSLRLLPVFPFFVINVVPAFVGVPLRTFVLATVLGIMPGSFVFASVGAGLGSVFEMMMEPTLASAITPEIIIALVALAVLALLPIVWKKLKARGGL